MNIFDEIREGRSCGEPGCPLCERMNRRDERLASVMAFVLVALAVLGISVFYMLVGST